MRCLAILGVAAFVPDHPAEPVLRLFDFAPLAAGHTAVRHCAALHAVDATLLQFEPARLARRNVSPLVSALDALVLVVLALVNTRILRKGGQ